MFGAARARSDTAPEMLGGCGLYLRVDEDRSTASYFFSPELGQARAGRVHMEEASVAFGAGRRAEGLCLFFDMQARRGGNIGCEREGIHITFIYLYCTGRLLDLY